MTTEAITTVEFHGATLVALAGVTPADTLVAMKPPVEGMKLTWEPQHRKIRHHPVLGTCMINLMMQMPGDDQAREHAFMPLNRLSFWLATIQPNKVPDPATRARVIEYQTECADALFAHFFGKTVAGSAEATAPRPFADLSLEAIRTYTGLLREMRQTFGRAAAAHVYRECGLPMLPSYVLPPWMQAEMAFVQPPRSVTVTIS